MEERETLALEWIERGGSLGSAARPLLSPRPLLSRFAMTETVKMGESLLSMMWSGWKRFKWRFDDENADRAKVREALPREGNFVYELGIAKGTRDPRTVYVGKGRAERMYSDHLGNVDGNGTEYYQAKTGPYMRKCIDHGYTIYIRFRRCRDNASAEIAETRLLEQWWRYPWNDRGMPWDGARNLYRKVNFQV